MTKIILLTLLLFSIIRGIFAQNIQIQIEGCKNTGYLYEISGDKIILKDSVRISDSGFYRFLLDKNKSHVGCYRFVFDRGISINFINDGSDVYIKSNLQNTFDSLKVIKSKSNILYYDFIKLNKLYKTTIDLLISVSRSDQIDEEYYRSIINKIDSIKTGYSEFVNHESQIHPKSFISRYIRSAQLPVVLQGTPPERYPEYLKEHSLDKVNFNDFDLTYSDVFVNKAGEYLSYYRNPKLNKDQLKQACILASDSILTRAKVNDIVYQQLAEYLIESFQKFRYGSVIDYIIENYIVKDDVCLDEKTEDLFKKRIEQARNFMPGNKVPEIYIRDIAGKEVYLDSINAEKVLIVFYASLCPHCRELMPILNEFKKNNANQNFEVLAISLDDDKAEWEKYAALNCDSFVNVSELKRWNSQSVKDYLVSQTPAMFLVDRNKKIISRPKTFEEVKDTILR